MYLAMETLPHDDAKGVDVGGAPVRPLTADRGTAGRKQLGRQVACRRRTQRPVDTDTHAGGINVRTPGPVSPHARSLVGGCFNVHRRDGCVDGADGVKVGEDDAHAVCGVGARATRCCWLHAEAGRLDVAVRKAGGVDDGHGRRHLGAQLADDGRGQGGGPVVKEDVGEVGRVEACQ